MNSPLTEKAEGPRNKQQATSNKQQATSNYLDRVNRVKPFWGLEPENAQRFSGIDLLHRHSTMLGFNHLTAYFSFLCQISLLFSWKHTLPLRDTTPTTRPAPTERPETEALPEGRGSHRVTAINPDTHNKNKPAFADGVAFARRVRKPDEPASRADDMPSEYQTGTSRVFQYAESDYGMMVDYATAYENGNGKRGPWSNVTSLLISG